MDITDFVKLEYILTSIKPNKIIHLAALSESEKIMKDAFDTIYINGVVACKICDILHKNNISTKFLNTCSSEIFKGHKNIVVNDDDRFFLPTYPYAFGKILSYNITEYYRNKYNYSFSNIILFPTESKNRKPGFLMSKIREHIESWKIKKEKLKLGCLYSYRNMLHVNDVVNAIKLILDQDKGNNYVIANDNSYLLLDIIIKFYKKHGICLVQNNNFLFELNTDDIVIEFEENQNENININGNSLKLKNLGWKIQYDLEHILEFIK